MYIKQVDVNTKDVFMGNGWANWVRYERQGEEWVRVKGMTVARDMDAAIKRKLNAWHGR